MVCLGGISITCAILLLPAGNYAGHIGAILAFIVGFFNTTKACGWKAGNIIDAIPADVVANVIIATAAALGVGICGSLVAADGVAAPLTRSPPSALTAGSGASDIVGDTSQMPEGVLSSPVSSMEHLSLGLEELKISGRDRGICELPQLLTVRPVVSDSSSSSLSDTDSLSDDVSYSSDQASSPKPTRDSQLGGYKQQTALVAITAAKALSCSSCTTATSSRIQAGGNGAFAAGPVVADTAAAAAASESMLIVHAGSSTTYPLTIMESWNLGLMSVSASPLAYRLAFGLPQPLSADYVPDAARLAACNRLTGWKVWLVSNALRYAR
jgi:hypothetical protein